ncbi:methylmalonyl Co-A mutase-associated GTPase MeaB [Aestuariibaculum suncheonense]|uniref:Methylmalonyl Co-A mutase-associated GTPase MeaB n=1 Tax=Aestuariibaculum suncheonense TaxID=1028745 RepID=A0A8J6UB12_9FLAO|nr:methylmalonyl Co-A mutase-associated GTPase MeaB [Aestuariibaculum suncheonense]MBD0835888.1 methylmalonyl Co-A mutase-associated GTPase MeaB [Aestuariibaculum suncheonense]
MVKHKTSALQESQGVSNSEITNVTSIAKIKSKRKTSLDVDALISGILNNDISALSRGITLIESTNPEHTEKANTLLKSCLPHANKSIRIGITGVPGVGKSTFIEAFGTFLTSISKRVAVLAVDPSSSLSKGSILGDKTRMEALVKDKNAFIRPSAASDALGGVARTTRESIILCEAAGFDVILIETVGVGQSETAVHSMVDFFLLLQLTGAGDELQGIKRGIIEMADAIVINKADGTNLNLAKTTESDLRKTLHLYNDKPSGWTPKVSSCSAIENRGITDIWNIIQEYIEVTTKNKYFNTKRNEQNTFWLLETIKNALTHKFFNNDTVKTELQHQLKRIEQNETTPFAAAEFILQMNPKA